MFKDINTKNPETRAKTGFFVSLLGIGLNAFLFIIKLLASLFSGSVSIAADAFNNLSDAAGSVVTLIGFKLSRKPADKDHPFGHGRMEYITGFIVSLIILLMGFELIKSSFSKLLNPEPVVFSYITVIILVLSVIIKLLLFLFNLKASKKLLSESLKASATDALSDAIATTAVLFSLIFFNITGINIDAYMGTLVSLFILYAGYKTVKDALSPLVGESAPKELIEQIEKTVLSHEEVTGIHDLIIHNYGVGKFMLSLHAEISQKRDFLSTHDKIDLIEKELSEKFNLIAVIHMDPVDTDSALANELKDFVISSAKSIDENLSIHDFRVIAGKTHTNIIFDLAVPFDFYIGDKDLLAALTSLIKEKDENYYVSVTIEKGYL